MPPYEMKRTLMFYRQREDKPQLRQKETPVRPSDTAGSIIYQTVGPVTSNTTKKSQPISQIVFGNYDHWKERP